MVIGSDELERIVDDIYKDRILPGSLYCSNCGYNLRTLPYVYVCPECGHAYNARPLSMKGIFVPSEIEIPIREIVSALACVLSALILGFGAFAPLDVYRLLFSAFFVVLTIVFTWQAAVRVSRFVRGIAIVRRIAQNEGVDE